MESESTRRVVVAKVVRPALVLSSVQSDDDVDGPASAELGIEVVRRRSGGGAVLLVPDEHVWIDLEVPADDDLWDDDVSRSFSWVGDTWARALSSLGVDGLAVEPVECSACPDPGFARAVCFAGVGSGEVRRNGRKLVGMSQRRTREGARFQCVVHRRWRPEWYERLLAPRLVAPDASRWSVTDLQVATVDASVDDIVAAFAASLP